MDSSQITRVTAPDGSFLRYTYNSARRLTTVSNNAGETIDYDYNANGDVTSTTVKASGGAIVRQQTALFDELGRLMRQIGASAQQWDYDYDRTDNLTEVSDPRSGLYSYAYDALSRLIRETDQERAQVNLGLDGQDNVTSYSDPRSIVTAYVRNGFGEVIQEASPDFGTTVLVRDARGLVTQSTDGRGVVANMAYDAAGRLLTVSYPSASGQTVTYSYDDITSGNKGVGRLTKVQSSGSNVQWTYNALGQVTKNRRVINAIIYDTLYQYDAAGNVTQMTYPSGRIVTFTRNSLGQVTSVATQANGGAPVFTVASGVTWKPMSGLLSSLTHGNGLVTGASYDLDYRLTGLSVMDGGTPLSSLSYGYGDGLNLTAVNDNVVSANSAALGYTPANRLATANGPWGNASYSYDSVGNRLNHIVTQGGTTTTRLASHGGANNRITGMTENGAALRTYTHDGNGNILTDTRPGEVFAFTYNVRNRPTSVTRNSVAYATYIYNGLEQLVSRSTSAPGGPSGTIHYIYDLAGHLIAEADGATGTTTREYIWLDDLPIGLVQGGTLYLVHSDHLARPIRITDASRSTVWQATWGPWGEPHAISGTLALDMRFPGQLFQIESGLHYNWHRHYDPVTGRYTQPDPLRFVDGPSVYAYAGSSPYIEVDEKGLQRRRGERGATGGSSGHGTSNPYKHCREHPTDPKKIICKDHQTGKSVIKPKPADWPTNSKMCGESCTDEAATVVVVGGAGYIIYRCLRMLPSILAPPTAIPNLLIP